jgi:signal transduction histidine kinase
MGNNNNHTTCFWLITGRIYTLPEIFWKLRVIPCFFLLLPVFTSGQKAKDPGVLEASSIEYAGLINEYVFYEFGSKPVRDTQIPTLGFTGRIPGKNSMNIPYEMVNQTLYLKFMMSNSSDSLLQVYFFPGFYYKKIEIFSASPEDPVGSFRNIKTSPGTDSGAYDGFDLISMPPKTTRLFFVKLSFAKTPVNILGPRIINKSFITYFRTVFLARKSRMSLITYVVTGILLMMIFYSLAVYLQNFNIEFLYYSGYAFSMGILLFLKSALSNTNTPFNYFFESYLDFFIQFVGYIFYIIFIRKFLDTRRNHPFLEKLFLFSQWFIFLLLAAFSVTYFFTTKFGILSLIENGTKQFLLAIGIIFIIYGIRKKDKLMNYLVAGQSILIFFSAISLFLIINPIHFVESKDDFKFIFNDSLLYYETGLVLELIFFLSGLAYKNKKEIIERVKERESLKLENERKEFEKQVAVLEAKQEERNRISADMHDELGSGVTAIRLMSEIVKTKMKGQTLPEIDKISYSANDLLNKMNTIIWTMTSTNDSVQSLVAYIRAYTVEFFDNTGIDCQFYIDPDISAAELSGEKRRNIFLSVKESLNNVAKHSMASKVSLAIDTNENILRIKIADNGRGIDQDKISQFSNGLRNMKRRIESIYGDFIIENKQGTTITFTLKI